MKKLIKQYVEYSDELGDSIKLLFEKCKPHQIVVQFFGDEKFSLVNIAQLKQITDEEKVGRKVKNAFQAALRWRDYGEGDPIDPPVPDKKWSIKERLISNESHKRTLDQLQKNNDNIISEDEDNQNSDSLNKKNKKNQIENNSISQKEKKQIFDTDSNIKNNINNNVNDDHLQQLLNSSIVEKWLSSHLSALSQSFSDKINQQQISFNNLIENCEKKNESLSQEIQSLKKENKGEKKKNSPSLSFTNFFFF